MTTTPTTPRRRARKATTGATPVPARRSRKAADPNPLTTKATPKAAAPVVEAPAFKPASKTDPANITATNLVGFPIAPWIPEHLRDRVGNPVKGHKGYFVRVPFASFAFAAKVEDVKGPNWWVVCEHGTAHEATGISSGDMGCEKVATRRAEWCDACAAAKASQGTAGAGAEAKREAHRAVANLIRAEAAKFVTPDGIDRDRFAEACEQIAAYHDRLAAPKS
jgi:hypothetical protein